MRWIPDSVRRGVRQVQRRRALEALTREERDAQLVLVSLLPEGKPDDYAEQVALILARLKDDPGHACYLAAQWLEAGSSDEPIRELLDACWQSHPEEARLLVKQWSSPGQYTLIKVWAEHLLPLRTDWAAQQVVLLLKLHQGGNYVDLELLMAVLRAMESWEGESRQQILVAMRPLWERVFINPFEDHGYDEEEVVRRLWEYDNSLANRAWLDTLRAANQEIKDWLENPERLAALDS